MMELQAPEQQQSPPKFELNGLRRGHFVKLEAESGFLWAAVRGRQADVFYGVVEHSYPGGPPMGTRVSFEKRHVFEIV